MTCLCQASRKEGGIFDQLESDAAEWLSSDTEDWREERAAVMSASMAV